MGKAAPLYSYTQGRFTAIDPLLASATSIRPQSWNRYTYCFNNPLKYTDPSGMAAGGEFIDRSFALGGFGVYGNLDFAVSYDDALMRMRAELKAVGGAGAAVGQWVANAVAGALKAAEKAVANVERIKLSNATSPDQLELLASGRAEAAKRAQSGECADFFGGAKKALKDLNSLTFTIDEKVDGADITGSKVSLNSNSQLLTPDDTEYPFSLVSWDGQKPTGVFILYLPGVVARAFGQLHETGHKAKVFGNTDADDEMLNSFVNNWKTWKACFSEFTPSVWKGPPTFPVAAPRKW